MSTFLNALIQTSESIDARNAPIDLIGGHPIPSFLTKTLEEIAQLASRDTAPFHLSDVVGTSTLFSPDPSFNKPTPADVYPCRERHNEGLHR
jgi:hypothetical protein